MTTTAITQDEIDAVFPKVAETMADALGCEIDDIKPNVSLIEGLDAESIDFLDMVFRLERAFKIKIPRGKIVENARGTLTEGEFEQKASSPTSDGAVDGYLSKFPPTSRRR
jgi:acyl carrier protein